jgi:hypothetical protein
MHRRVGSDPTSAMAGMRQSTYGYAGKSQHTTRFGKARLRYVFTIENCTLVCGSALLMPASAATPPTVSLTWTSGRKKTLGGVVRALAPHEGSGARWSRPISMACSLTSNVKGEKRFEPRSSTITLRVEGAKAARRKLVGTLDLAKHASYERTSSRLTVPLEHGAGSLQLDLTAGWLKKAQLDDDEGSECSRSSLGSSRHSDDDDDDDDVDGAADGTSFGLVASHPGQSELASLEETSEDHRWGDGDADDGPALTASAVSRLGALRGLGAGPGAGGGVGGSPSPPTTPRKDDPGPTPPPGGVPPRSMGSMMAGGSPGQGSSASAEGHCPSMRRSCSHGALCEGADAPGSSRPGHRRVPSGGSLLGTTLLGGRLHHAAFASPAAGGEGPGTASPAPQRAGAPSSSSELSGGGHSLPSMFAVPIEAMEEVLRLPLPVPLDVIQSSFEGFDCEHSPFGTLLCRRLGYMEIDAGAWEGNEAEGMRREVRLVVKCPPKPMLPDTTRVHLRHKLQRQSQSTLMLEREVWTLDVPYGETWCLQERWLVATDPSDPSAVELAVCAHVSFRSRGMLAAKIKAVALKRSRKCAALAAQLLEEAAAPEAEVEAASGGAAVGAGESEELRELRERHDALLEEAHFYKQQAAMFQRENRRLQEAARHVKKTKKTLTQQLQALEYQLQKERRERAAMEEALSEAYSQTLKEIVHAHESEIVEAAARERPALSRAGANNGAARRLR